MTPDRNSPLFIVLYLSLLLGACGAEPPVHYPQAERSWRLPLADEARGRGLLVPVTISGSGPYLFLLSPDATVSTIDRGLAESLDLYTGPDSWRGFLDHRDRVVPMRPYEVLSMKSGNLHLSNFIAYGAPAGSLDIGDVPVHGIIGGNLLTRTVVIDVDRKAGEIRLSITGTSAPLDHPLVVAGTTWRLRNRRKLVVDAHIEGLGPVILAVDLASTRSALRADRLDELSAAAAPDRHVWQDEFGSETTIDVGKEATLVLPGGMSRSIRWAELPDRRLWASDIDGVLGLDALDDLFRFDPDRRELSLAPTI